MIKIPMIEVEIHKLNGHGRSPIENLKQELILAAQTFVITLIDLSKNNQL